MCGKSPAARLHHSQAQASLRNPEGSQQRNPGRLIFSLPLLSQDAAPPWMCVWPPPMQQGLEETQRRRHLVANCPTAGKKSQTCATRASTIDPLFGQRRGDHTAVTRTLQCAADIASSRTGQQMSAKSLQRRWKHEVQIALLRRRAAMTRAVLPNPSARAEWFFAGIIDGALHHWGHVPPAIPENATVSIFAAIKPPVAHSCPYRAGCFLLFRCVRVTWSLTLASKITKCPGWSLTICLHLSGRPTGSAFQRNLLSQLCRGTTGENSLASCMILLPPLTSRPQCTLFPSALGPCSQVV